jgi:hypothetical protein
MKYNITFELETPVEISEELLELVASETVEFAQNRLRGVIAKQLSIQAKVTITGLEEDK